MDAEPEHQPSPSKSRFGRTRKPKISADFLNTDDLFGYRSNGKAKPQISVLKSPPPQPIAPPQLLAPPPAQIKPPPPQEKSVATSAKRLKLASPPPLQAISKPLKFFKSKTAEPEATEEHDIDVNKVMKLVTPRHEFAAAHRAAVLKGRVKTYSNRKRPHQTHVVESFGLPDTPIVPTYDDDVWDEESGANLKNEEPFSPPVTPQYVNAAKPPRQAPPTPQLLARSVMTSHTDNLVVHKSPDSPPVYIITPKDNSSAPPKRSPQIKILEDIVFVKGRSTEAEEEEVYDAPEVVVEEEIDCRDSCETFVLDEVVLDDGGDAVVLNVDGNFVHSNVEFLDEDLAGYEGQVVEIADANEAISSSLDVELDDGEDGLVVCMASSSNELSLGIVDDGEEDMLLQVEDSVSDVVDEIEANSTTAPHSEEPPESADENIPQEEAVAPPKEAEVPRESVPVSIKRSLIKTRPSSDKSKLSPKKSAKKSPKKTARKKLDDALVSSTKPTATSPRKSRRFENAKPVQVPTPSDEKIESQDAAPEVIPKAESPRKIRTRKSRVQEQQSDQSDETMHDRQGYRDEVDTEEIRSSEMEHNVVVPRTKIESQEVITKAESPRKIRTRKSRAQEQQSDQSDETLFEVSPSKRLTRSSKTDTATSNGGEKLAVSEAETPNSEAVAKSEVSILSLQTSPQKILNRETAAKSKVSKPNLQMSLENASSEETAAKSKASKPNLQTFPQKTLSEETATKSKVRKPNLQTSLENPLSEETAAKSKVSKPNLQTFPQKTLSEETATKSKVRKSNLQASHQKTVTQESAAKLQVSKPNLQTSPQKTSNQESDVTLKISESNLQISPQKITNQETAAKLEVSKPNLQTSPQKTLSEETATKSRVRKSNLQTSQQKTVTQESAAKLQVSKPNLQTSSEKTSNQESDVTLKTSESDLQISPQKTTNQETAAKLEVGKPDLQTSPQKTTNQEAEAKSEVNLESSPNLSKPNLRKSPKKTPTWKSKLRKSNLETSPLKKINLEAVVKLEVSKHNLQTSPRKTSTRGSTTNLDASESNLQTSAEKTVSGTKLKASKDNLQTSPQKTSTRGSTTNLEVSESNLQTAPEKTATSVKLKSSKRSLQTSPRKTATRGSTTNLDASISNLQTSPEKTVSGTKLKATKDNLQTSPRKTSTRGSTTNLEVSESNLETSPEKTANLEAVVKLEVSKRNLQTSPQKSSTRGSTTNLDASESNLQTSPEKNVSGTKLKASKEQTSPQKTSTRGSTTNLEVSISNLQTSPEKSANLEAVVKLELSKRNLQTSPQKTSTRGSTTNLDASESNLQTSPEKTVSGTKLKASKDNLQTSPQKTSTRGSTTNLEVSISNLQTSPEKTANQESGVKLKGSKPNLQTSPQKTSTRGSTANLEVSKPNLQNTENQESDVKLKVSKPSLQTSPQKPSTRGTTTDLEASKPNLQLSPQKTSTRGTTTNLEASKRNLQASRKTLNSETVAKSKAGKPNLQTPPQKPANQESGVKLKASLQTSPQKPAAKLEVIKPNLQMSTQKTLNSEAAAKLKPGKSKSSTRETQTRSEVSNPNLETPGDSEDAVKSEVGKSKRRLLGLPDDSETATKSEVGKSKRRLLSLKHTDTPVQMARQRKVKTSDDQDKVTSEGEVSPVKTIVTRSSTAASENTICPTDKVVTRSASPTKQLGSSSERPSDAKKEVKVAKRKSDRLSTKTRLGDISDDVELIKQALQPPPNAEVEEDVEADEWEDVVVVKKEPVSAAAVQSKIAESLYCRFVDGDLAYARLGHFPYWPCMITKDPVTKLIRKKSGPQKWNTMWSYHVRFFGDRGRRSWVRENKIIPLKGKNDFANNIKELKREKKFLQIPAFKVPTKLSPVWTAGLEEALSLRTKTTKQRYDFFFNMFASDEEKVMRDKEAEPPFTQVIVKQEVVSDAEDEPPASKPKKVSDSPVESKPSDEQSKPKTRPGFQIDVASECSLSDTDSSSKWSVQTPLSVSNESQTALYKRNKLFKGVTRERVCVVCLKNGDVLKCKGKCYGFYHRPCSAPEAPSENVQIVNVKNRHYEHPKLTLSNDRKFREMTLAEKIDFKLKEIMMPIVDKSIYADSTTDYTSSEESSSEKSSVLVEHVTADDVIFASKLAKKKKTKPAKVDDDFRCSGCASGRDPECFACNRDVSLRGSVARQKCSVASCGKYYHPACLKPWPQTQFTLGSSAKDTFTCPMHVCHICVSDNPRTAISRVASDKVVRCVKCPATYHSNTFCIPAGTSILSTAQIVCPRHLEHDSKGKPKRTTINATWCFICARGGDLICCETCPTSVHAECSPLNLLDDDTFVCEECETGRLPLYDEIVWVKLGQYRWWPALILFPNDVPDNVRVLPHAPGEFVVKFFGTHDHYWVGRGRVFLFQEGDQGPGGGSKKKRVDRVFRQAVEEAAAVHNFKIEFKKNVEEATKSEEKPPYYIKIRLNKPVGNVKLFDGNVSNTTPCNCDPNMANPCGVDSYCLNRLLLTECDPEVCPAGDRCQNQCFEKRQYPPLAPYKTEARGWGLKALAPIQKGQFIIEYVGEVIDLAEYQRRLAKMHEQMDDNYYFLTIDKDRMIDAGPKGNLARFMNHCCEPNSETQKWTVKGDTRVGLFATKDIPVDSEVTFNYNLECVGEEKKICKCGAPSCSGFIGVKAKSSNEEKKVKRQRKKRSPTPVVLSPNVEPCFVCGDAGDTFACHNKICNKFYHLRCVGMDAMPDGKWSCPWHNCNLCSKRTIRCCVKCTNSYCPLHSEGNVRYDKLLGFICTEHDPTKEPQDLSTSPVKKTKKSSISTEESDVTSTTQEEADGDVAAKPEEPVADEPSSDARPTLPRLGGGGVPYPKRKRGKQRRKLHLRKRIKFDEQYKHFSMTSGAVKAPPSAAPEVILTSSVPERHLRVGRKTSEDSESDRLLKRRRAFEKDLPMRKRTTPRTESADN